MGSRRGGRTRTAPTHTDDDVHTDKALVMTHERKEQQTHAHTLASEHSFPSSVYQPPVLFGHSGHPFCVSLFSFALTPYALDVRAISFSGAPILFHTRDPLAKNL